MIWTGRRRARKNEIRGHGRRTQFASPYVAVMCVCIRMVQHTCLFSGSYGRRGKMEEEEEEEVESVINLFNQCKMMYSP